MENKAYKLKLDGKLSQVYCNMNGHALGGCGGGGVDAGHEDGRLKGCCSDINSF